MKKWERIEFCTGKGSGGGSGCQRKFFVQEEDLFLTTDYRNGKKEITYQCPYCGVQTDIEEADVPETIRNKILK